MTRTAVQAVLTGDIVNSTALSGKLSAELLPALEAVFGNNHFEFYRGDAFQLYLPEAGNALEIALLCRCLAIAISGSDSLERNDVRIGIGLGEVNGPVDKLGTARGEAFLLSGRGFDSLAVSGERLIIAASGGWPALALAILGDEINGIFSAITARQAAVLVEMLKGNTQRDTALRLGKSQSTVHQHLVAAHWPQIEKCLQHYRDAVALLNE